MDFLWRPKRPRSEKNAAAPAEDPAPRPLPPGVRDLVGLANWKWGDHRPTEAEENAVAVAVHRVVVQYPNCRRDFPTFSVAPSASDPPVSRLRCSVLLAPVHGARPPRVSHRDFCEFVGSPETDGKTLDVVGAGVRWTEKGFFIELDFGFMPKTSDTPAS